MKLYILRCGRYKIYLHYSWRRIQASCAVGKRVTHPPTELAMNLPSRFLGWRHDHKPDHGWRAEHPWK